MFVCNCNGIREREVRHAVQNGAASPAQIFRQHGCAAKCGRCIQDMQMVLSAESKSAALVAE